MWVGRARLLHAVLIAAAAGCNSGSSGGRSAAPAHLPANEPTKPGGQNEAPFGLETRPPPARLKFPLDPPPSTPLRPVEAFPRLRFESPVFLTSAPDGSDRIYVVEQTGRVKVFENDGDVDAARVFLDLTDRTGAAGEQGLLGLAFDPEYAATQQLYVYYSAQDPRRSVISRFHASPGDPGLADPGSEEVILEVEQPFTNHKAGMLAFGLDRLLYIGLGDGGSAGDPFGNGQDLTTLLGSILRIDPRGQARYAVPPDNPFASGPGGARPEIWAYGLRNPWRFSFDRVTGKLWVGDVGQSEREEIDVVTAGANLGWNAREGTLEFEKPEKPPASRYVEPVLDYGRSEGQTVIGGNVYRGRRLPSIVGAYLYGDYGSQHVWALRHDGRSVVSNVNVADVLKLVSFGEDAAGEIYAVSYRGIIYRFEETKPSASKLPRKLSGTGLFKDVASLEPSDGLIEYDVVAPLWSDGASKRRWIALPGDERIEFDADGAWEFPLGTAFVKHFEVPGRRLETRVLLREKAGWAGYTYRWDPSGADADLLEGSAEDVVAVEDPAAPGGTRSQTWRYPSRTDCLRCHTEAAGHVLGVRTAQLNRTFAFPLATDNQLRTWGHIGLFSTDVGDPGKLPVLADPRDESESMARRARSYLDANCSQCHRPGGPAPGGLDLRADVPPAEMNVVRVRPLAGDLGLRDAQRVKPGAKESSVLWERVRRTDENRMPPLASSVVDPIAVKVIGAWIDRMR